MDFEKIRARLDKLVAEGRKGELRGALSMLSTRWISPSTWRNLTMKKC